MGVILMFFFFLSFCFVFFWDGPTNWRHLRYNAQMSGVLYRRSINGWGGLEGSYLLDVDPTSRAHKKFRRRRQHICTWDIVFMNTRRDYVCCVTSIRVYRWQWVPWLFCIRPFAGWRWRWISQQKCRRWTSLADLSSWMATTILSQLCLSLTRKQSPIVIVWLRTSPSAWANRLL